MKVREMTLVALFAAVTCVLSVFTIPIGAVPLTLQVFAVVLAGTILGGKLGLMSQVVYVLIGAVGLPVFSGMKGGLGVLTGPTGGYIIGFVLAAGLIGSITQWSEGHFESRIAYVLTFAGMVLGLVVIYTIGTLQLALVTGMGVQKAISAGALPFLLPDFLKICGAFVVAVPVRMALKKANLIAAKAA